MSIERKFEHYDQSITEGFIRANDALTGLPAYLGIRITGGAPGTMSAEMEVRKEHLTPFGNAHGGVVTALCDHILGCVCYPLMKRGQWAATTEFKVNLLSPVTTGPLVAEAHVVTMTRTLAVVRIDVENNGRLACIAQGTVLIRDPKPK